MERRLIIVGAGGFGREVYAWIKDIRANGEELFIGGFLDRNADALDGFGIPEKVLADPQDYLPDRNDVFVCALGEPASKLHMVESLQSRGARFISIIHPTAIVGPGCVVGDGAILCPYAVLTSHVTVGNAVTFNVHAGAGHDAVLGDGCTLSAHCDITGGAKLGRGVLAGSHSTVLPGVAVGDAAVIGAGSVVVRNVPPATTVMGVPAKKIWTANEER